MAKTWAPQEVQKTLFTVLSGDAELQTKIGGVPADPKVYDLVPQGVAYPYITIDVNMSDRGNQTGEGWQGEPQINVWAQGDNFGKKFVQEVQKRIDELIHNQNLCVDGWNLLVCKRTIADVFKETDNVTVHGVQRFKINLGDQPDGIL